MLDKPKKVIVLMGGRSTEREISIKSGVNVFNALQKKGYDVLKTDLDNLIEAVKEHSPDIVFITLHGQFGEDGTVQGLLDILNIPYTGSSVLGSAIAMNKIISKKIFQLEKIPTPKFLEVYKENFCEEELFKNIKQNGFLFPFVIKPANQGSTIGVFIVNSEIELFQTINEDFKLDNEIIIEEYIKGRELTVGMIGNRDLLTLPPIEVIPKNTYYDYESKYSPGMSTHIVPAKVTKKVEKELEEFSKKAFRALKCSDFARADFMLDGNDNPYLLEINTIPGFTATSLLPDAAKAIGINFEDLTEKILIYAWRRWKEIKIL